jgi:hypothetical protein
MSIWEEQQKVAGQADEDGEPIMQRTTQVHLYMFLYQKSFLERQKKVHAGNVFMAIHL